MDVSNVAAHYDTNPHYEWARLERHRTEFAVTQHVLTDYLPSAPATIIDIGGGLAGMHFG
jgi:S-adenosylmethionine-dependent methyltransferase